LSEDTGLVVISQAVPQSHLELITARAKNIPVVTYPQCLGALMVERLGTAVAGTHGKTTVTSMVVSILRAAGMDPGFVIGGYVPSLGAGADAGTGKIFVAEACEFNRSFLDLRPKVAVITNIEADHLDVYKDLAEIQAAFRTFANHVQELNGVLIYSTACPNTPPVLNGLNVQTRSFGLEADGVADYCARNITSAPDGVRFDIFVDNTHTATAHLPIFGRHNIANAVAAVAVCHALGVSVPVAAGSLETFEGAKRRFEIRGEAAGITVVDDYAHHPTAVRLLLEAAATRYVGRRIVITFQPHQFSRTRLMLDDFARSLCGAQRVVISNIYFARDTEEDVRRLRPEALSEAVSALGTEACYIGDLDSTATHLVNTLETGDVLILAGAGDIDSIAEPVLSGLEKRFR
jgi:UDP-N-acetylmuramate--alanine ligase